MPSPSPTKQLPFVVPMKSPWTLPVMFIEEVNIPFDLSPSVHAAPSIRPATRRHIATLRDHLLLELRTWAVIHAT